ncbi:MAG: hemophore-related protein, partial [Mycobacterium sp.]
STGDYLDSHPETNQVITSVLQQPPGPESIDTLKTYFGANPKVQNDMAKITEPLTDVTTKCRLGVSLPQVLGLLQALQGQGGLPGAPGMQLAGALR